MPTKIPFGPEPITVQRHTQYSIQATDGTYYRVNAPLTLFHFQDGMTYNVSGSVSAKGNKYISEIVDGTPAPVAQPQTIQQPGLPPLPPVPSADVPAPATPVAPAVPAPTPYRPKPKFIPKNENVEGKVACALGAGLVQYLASVSNNEADFITKYQTLLPQLIAFHKDKGWM